MMKIDVKNWENEVVGQAELPENVFGRKVGEHLVWEVVRAFLASSRRGTHKTKERGEVVGSGVKPWKQKHTGRARAGDRRSPLWRHGGTTFGPRPRSYVMKVNKKARRAALAGVLSQRGAEGQVVVLESLVLPEAKTKSFLERLDRLGLAGEKVLFIDGLENLNLYLASRNRPELLALDPRSVNAYEVLNHRWIVTTQDGLKGLAEVLS